MGTRFRTMLAPIDTSTGDGRRFATDGISMADTPFPFEWARTREGGHDGAVAVGAVQEVATLSVADAIEQGFISADRVEGLDRNLMAVWGRGELFDGVDRETMPRLAEDTAEVLHLIESGTLGPSVDLDSFEAVPVMKGGNDPVTWEVIEEYMDANDGAEPDVELLITAGRVRAATLVTIPAFHETSRPLELIASDPIADEEEGRDTGEARAREITLVASFSAPAPARPTADAFALHMFSGPTPITWDWETGRVYGHIATWQTCHVGYEGVCVTPPREDDSYSWFNRFTVETADGGAIGVGRITVGGRHAGLSLSANAAMSAYDDKTVAAHVRAYADEHGIAVCGVIEPGLSDGERAILERRKVSGDWREAGGRLSLVEVLALSPGPRAHSEPGFPVETFSRAGRQVSLTAALGPEPDTISRFHPGRIDIRGAVVEELARLDAAAVLTAIVEADENQRAGKARAALAMLVGEG